MPRGSHMTTRYGGQTGSFSLQIENWANEALGAIEQTFKDVVIQIGETLVNLSPVDTGLFKGNWQLTIDAPSNHSIDRHDKEGSETISALIAAANSLEPGQTAWLVNNLIYSIPLEYGHSQQAPAGVVRITVAQFQKIVREAAQRNQV